MEVETPSPWIFDFKSEEKQPRVLIQENYWEIYQRIQNSLPPLDVGLDVDQSTLLWIANRILEGSITVAVGWLQVELTFFAIAVWAGLKCISIVPYEIIAYPGIFGEAKFPFKFGSETYTIKPVEKL